MLALLVASLRTTVACSLLQINRCDRFIVSYHLLTSDSFALSKVISLLDLPSLRAMVVLESSPYPCHSFVSEKTSSFGFRTL